MIYNLPPITFAAKDPDAIKNGMLAKYKELSGRTLAPADPTMTLFEVFTAQFVSLRAAIDFTGKQNLLAYAEDDYLKHRVSDFGLKAKEAVKARVSMIFTMTQKLSYGLTIKKGTRVTADSKFYFEVPESVTIQPGDISALIICVATIGGDAGNLYKAGLITNLVDPIAYIGGVVNIDDSTGGDDDESNDSLRERRLLAPEALSTAGPDNAYKYWAKSATTDVIDVEVYSPEPGVVRIVPLMADGRMPTKTELELILVTCNPSDKRPLTDNVEVAAPTQVDYGIKLKYWISSKTNIEISQVQDNVDKAIRNFIYLTKTKLGRAINPSVLNRMIMDAGARRTQIDNPVQAELNSWKVGNNISCSVEFGGIEEDC